MKLLPHRELAHVPGNLATMHQQIQTPAPDGAMRQYVQSHAQDELLKIYRRACKRRFAWIRAEIISQEACSAWSKEAQKEKEKCESGKISQRKFAQWLKR